MGKAKRIDQLKKSFKSNKSVQKPKSENPFDKFANARKKFDILNRKVKGEDRNVGRARAKAIDERKRKLLSEIKQSKRSNELIDKRFGESDPSISLEEKLFLRFQRDRMKKARNSSLFNLDEEKTEVLTHKGNILGESNLHDTDWISDDDDGNGKIHKDVVNKLHFGGGLVPKQNQSIAEGEEKEQTKKNRLDALQEIVMKSKYFKMQRKEAKEEQEIERKRLDEAFDELFSANMIEYNDDKDKKRPKFSRDEIPAEDADDYDQKMREMMYEPKVQPSDRLKTQEELAIETKERIEKLERERLRRMRRSTLDESDEKDLKAAKHKRKRNDDELDEMEFGADKNSYKTNGDLNSESSDDAEEEEEFEDFNDDLEESDEEEGDGDEEDISDEEEVSEFDEEGDSDDFEEDEDAEDMEGEEEEDLEAEDEDDKPIKVTKPLHDRSHSPLQELEEMPHKVQCPNSIEELLQLISRYCQSSSDRIELIRRIVQWNNVHLPGEEGKENKRKMHNFLNTLLKYFIDLGDSICNSASEEELAAVWEELHALTGLIFQITQDLQKSCIPLFSRTIKIIHEQNQKSFRDYQQGEQSSCLMSLGKLLFFQLISHLFATTDLQNPMVNVSILILTQQLTQCPIKSSRELYQGLITARVLLSSYTSLETKKLIPEVMTFLSSVIACFLPRLKTLFPPSANTTGSDTLLQNIYYHREFYRSYRHYVLNNLKYAKLSSLRSLLSDHLRQNLSPVSPDLLDATEVKIEWKYFSDKIAVSEGEVLNHLLSSTYRLILHNVIPLYSDSNAFPEFVHPLYCLLQEMVPHQKPVLSDGIQSSHCLVLEKLKAGIEKVEKERKPLLWRESQGDTVEAKTPKYHLNYILKRDRAEYDSNNSERLQLKQLTRQLKREQKAAMRELRRDAGFIEQEQYKQRQAKVEKLREERQKNYQWLEEQQATINQQVRKGKGLVKGGGSFVAKKPRIGR